MEKMAEKETMSKADEIEWLPKKLTEDYYTETALQKLKRKCIESPMVPLGLFATIGALTYGLYNFYHNRQVLQQKSMRARVIFQGFTLAAICYSMYSEGQKRLQKDREGKAKTESPNI